MKGIILAGGLGTRLYPTTLSFSKQLLPVYDKPMIYYPLSVLMLANIKDILIITTKKDLGHFINFFGDGKFLGLNLEYAVQDEPKGLAEAFIIGDKFIGNSSVALILGDNIFYGQGFRDLLLSSIKLNQGEGKIFAYPVKDPHRFGVVEFNEEYRVLSIEEKPINPKSNYAITGLYFYDNCVVDYAKEVTPSTRGELEITDINQMFLANGKLKLELLGRGFAWLDTGTPESMLEASNFVRTIEERQGYKIACLEEIAFNNKWINEGELTRRIDLLAKSDYGKYLENILKGFH